ncbi:hypothetical protein M569_05384 [Genlisea aurea]|uniref:Uncharacterized protein n=1 Tax=Genlisea aurea TaxID=192259 RepID=S8CWS8_9LAMI|nr:hypothetical protein M569_05384 [Genlisea aurea]
METAEAMDVEEESSSSGRSTTKRFALRNSIQTNFGGDYVFQIVSRRVASDSNLFGLLIRIFLVLALDDWSSIAVSLSTNVVKLYSPLTGTCLGDCSGHSSTINQISFVGPSSPHVLYSCSSDGTLRAWDSRSFQQISCINRGSQEVFSFSFGGAGNNLLAAGCDSEILFWDWRTMKQIACLEEYHIDDVTQVQFVPGRENKLVSASVDGLMCLFETDGGISDRDKLLSVFNVGTSIGKIGFFGDEYRKLCIWDWEDNINEVNFEDARALASQGWTLDQIDYFVDCVYSEYDDKLMAIGGTNGGSFSFFPVKFSRSRGKFGSAKAVFHGGHVGVVRSVLLHTREGRGAGETFGWTGGEDGRLCCWKPSETLTTPSYLSSSSWASTALVRKSSVTRNARRYSPY